METLSTPRESFEPYIQQSTDLNCLSSILTDINNLLTENKAQLAISNLYTKLEELGETSAPDENKAIRELLEEEHYTSSDVIELINNPLLRLVILTQQKLKEVFNLHISGLPEEIVKETKLIAYSIQSRLNTLDPIQYPLERPPLTPTQQQIAQRITKLKDNIDEANDIYLTIHNNPHPELITAFLEKVAATKAITKPEFAQLIYRVSHSYRFGDDLIPTTIWAASQIYDPKDTNATICTRLGSTTLLTQIYPRLNQLSAEELAKLQEGLNNLKIKDILNPHNE